MIVNPTSIEHYRSFLRIRQLPSYRFRGSVAEYPAEYAEFVSDQQQGASNADA